MPHPQPSRIIFVATGDIALPSFQYLLDNGPRPLALVTQPDKPAGRHQTLTPPSIKIAALNAGIPVLQPIKISDIAADLAALTPDVIVVMAYGQILRDNILNLPRHAIINLHASLLPRHRGAACIQAAIDSGDTETGITSMHVIRELDSGDVILTKSIPIRANDTGGQLHDTLAHLAPTVLAKTLTLLANHTAPRIPQDPSLATYIAKLGREDGRIDWTQPASAIERRIRAYSPWPGTFTTTHDGKRLKIFPPTTVVDTPLAPGHVLTDNHQLIVGCGNQSLLLSTVQPDGSKLMTTADYLRGKKPTTFGAIP